MGVERGHYPELANITYLPKNKNHPTISEIKIQVWNGTDGMILTCKTIKMNDSIIVGLDDLN
jgi:hypothetical protein